VTSTRAAEDVLEVCFIWCTALQAAAAALALLLPGHRRKTRLVLACAAFAAAVVSHCFTFASVLDALVAYDLPPCREPGTPLAQDCGTLFFVFIATGGDLLCFRALLSVSWELHVSAHESQSHDPDADAESTGVCWRR
jgi:hypothetical protein